MWLAHTTEQFRWRKTPHFLGYMEAVRGRAGIHGYEMDILDLGDRHLSFDRTASILRSRGIEGILVCPRPYPESSLTSIPWRDFAAVTLGHSLTEPLLHSVAAAQFRGAQRTMLEIYRRGYRRVGFVFGRGHNQRTDCNYLGGYLAAREPNEPGRRVPPLLLESPAANSVRAAFRSWYRRHTPDAILLGGSFLEKMVIDSGIHAPGDVGLGCPLLSSPDDALAGVWEANHLIGEAAVDMVVSMLHRGERGIPSQPRCLLVEGVRVPGTTLRELPEIRSTGTGRQTPPTSVASPLSS